MPAVAVVLQDKVQRPPEYLKLKGTVATVYTYPLSMGDSSNGHHCNNAKTYINVGWGNGDAMVKRINQSR